MTRNRLLGVSVAVVAVLLLVLGIVTGRALVAAAAEDRLQHAQLAARLFDEVERELNLVVEREEARSFLEYRYLYVPATPACKGDEPTLSLSPLSQPPSEPWIVGYFQVDPDGQVSLPLEPRPSERGLLDAAPTDASRERTSMAALVGGLDWGGGAPGGPHTSSDAAQAARTTANDPSFTSVGLYSQRKKARAPTTRNVTIDAEQVGPYRIDDTTADQPADTSSDVDVSVSAMSGQRVGDDLVLHRTVRIGPDSYRQGLVVRADALAQESAATVLREAGLDGQVAMGWSGPPPSGRYQFEHSFSAPFDGLQASVGMAEIASSSTGRQGSILVLGLLSGAITIAGALLVGGAVRRELEVAERRAAFVAAVTHELKTPLTSIRLYGELLRDGMVPSDERRQACYETITRESERLTRLVQGVLDVGKIERQQLELAPQPTALAPLLQQLVAVLGPHAQAERFELLVDAPSDLPLVWADPDALFQVLLNVVENAIKFSGAAADRRIRIAAAPDHDGVTLTVRDHGPGASTQTRRQMFEPFWRGEGARIGATPGTGLGLALARGLLAAMDATIAASAADGGGLLVSMTLKRRDNGDGRSSEGRSLPQPASSAAT